jgi:hypothetical protein
MVESHAADASKWMIRGPYLRRLRRCRAIRFCLREPIRPCESHLFANSAACALEIDQQPNTATGSWSRLLCKLSMAIDRAAANGRLHTPPFGKGISMSRNTSQGLLAIGLILTSSTLSVAQYPVPNGYSPYPPQPYGGPPRGYGVAPAGLTYAHLHQAPAAPYGSYDANSQAPAPLAPNGSGCNCCGHGRLPICNPFDGRHAAAIANMWAGLGSNLSRLRPQGAIAIDSLPTNPYTRSPRDFFMFYENLEAERSRDLRPTLVP